MDLRTHPELWRTAAPSPVPQSLGLDAWDHLNGNNAYPFFAALDDLLMTGPTQTNVNDLAFVFVW